MPVSLDYARLAQQLIATASRDLNFGVRLLQQAQPELVKQIQQDASRRGPLTFWGKSRNIDELTGTTIVDPAILRLISQLVGRKISVTTPHAGLQHTYGYLFSTIETPYGFKRDRWLETEIETAFGLHPTTLSPMPQHGTLLANATWLTGIVAFRRDEPRLHQLHRFLKTRAAADVVALDPTKWRQHRLVEQVATEWRQVQRAWTLQTDIVESNHRPQCSLLIYSVINHHTRGHQLITLFPIGGAMRDELLSRASKRRRDDLRARFNAWIPALADQEWSGTCRLQPLVR